MRARISYMSQPHMGTACASPQPALTSGVGLSHTAHTSRTHTAGRFTITWAYLFWFGGAWTSYATVTACDRIGASSRPDIRQQISGLAPAAPSADNALIAAGIEYRSGPGIPDTMYRVGDWDVPIGASHNSQQWCHATHRMSPGGCPELFRACHLVGLIARPAISRLD